MQKREQRERILNLDYFVTTITTRLGVNVLLLLSEVRAIVRPRLSSSAI